MRNVAHWEVGAGARGRGLAVPGGVGRRPCGASCAHAGIERLYGHQADSYRHVRAGDNVVLVTPTASGKTLAYNLPILSHFLRDAPATALYLFPTKALSQDQQAELDGLVQGGGLPVPAFTYDGGHAVIHPRPGARGRGASSSPTPTCCTWASCRTTRSGVTSSVACASS